MLKVVVVTLLDPSKITIIFMESIISIFVNLRNEQNKFLKVRDKFLIITIYF